jgi:ABC-type multidrug transport system fused ATPase/permease subunit
MIETYKKVWDILPAAQRRQSVVLFAMTTVMACLETIGVVSILPFMMVVADPHVLHQGGWLGTLYSAAGISDERSFLLLLGGLIFLVLLLDNAFKALTTWQINRFTQLTGHVLSVRLMRDYLAQPYEYFLTRHSAELGKNVLAEVQQVVSGVIQPGLAALTRLVIALFLGALLLWADPLLAVTVVVVLGGLYALLYAATRRYLTRIGIGRKEANRERYHISSEAFSGIKEVKLKDLGDAYADRFSPPSERFATTQASSQTLSQVPRFALEVISFGGILLVVLYLLAVKQGLANALPMIALYVFAGYRMLPTLQEIYASISKVRFGEPALNSLHRDMMRRAAARSEDCSAVSVPFLRSLRLEKVSYRYPAGERPVLTDLSLEIPRGARVGFVGPTGSGKSTVIDLILGLLRPMSGRVVIDDQALETPEQVRGWQRQIGYVPQHIFLADDTIAANIAFGQREAIDAKAVERAARMAQLHDFIVHELPQGYETRIGERGIRLSGGQRQRLGLARALYRDPAVLVLDEATSALDNKTEDAVMKAIDGLSGDCTIIMIAHRLSTVRRCDILFELEKGAIVAMGSYADVVGVKEAAHGGG